MNAGNVTQAVRDAVSASEPFRLADLPPAQRAYLRRFGAAHGLTTDAEIEASMINADDVAADDEVEAAIKGRRR